MVTTDIERRATLFCRAADVAYALLLGYLQEARGETLFETLWARVLDRPRSELYELAFVASKQGMLEYRNAGGVVEVGFRELVEAASSGNLDQALTAVPDGVRIESITTDSPASAAGLKVGEVIRRFDGNDISAPDRLTSILGERKPGDDVTLVLKRDGKSLDYVEGVLGDVTDERIEFKFDGDDLRIDQAKVAGFLYYRADRDAAATGASIIHGRSGLRASAQRATLVDDSLQMITIAGAELNWPLDDIYLADFSAGKLVHLSDLEPASERWTPLVLRELILGDFKEYTAGERSFGVGQVEVVSFHEFHAMKERIAASLEELRQERSLDVAGLLVTDIVQETSLLLALGTRELPYLIGYPQLEDNLFELRGVLSRKKQLVPHLLKVLKG